MTSIAQTAARRARMVAVLHAQPVRVLLALCAAQIVVWTLSPALTALSLPIDVIEGYLWGREWVLATYKHPSLPGWVLEASRIVTGRIGWPAFVISQLFIAATFVLTFLLGRDLMDARRGAAAALLMTGISFFSWSSAEFNHNIAQMPFWIGFIWTLWHATRNRGVGWWLLVGLFAAANLYTKLSCSVLLLVGGLWLLWEPRARAQLATPGPWLGLVVFLVLATPLARWLIANDFLPLDYAERRANSAHALSMPQFLIGQIGHHSGLLAMVVFAGLIGHAPKLTLDTEPLVVTQPGGRAYLVIMTLGPLLILMLAALVMDMNLKPAWTASISTLSGLLAIVLTSGRLNARAFRRLQVMAAAMLLGGAGVYAADSVWGVRDRAPYRPQQAAWPADAIARQLLAAWSNATAEPLRIVVGETRVAGIVALRGPSVPSLVTEADLWRSPWVTPERLRRQGALLVWADPGGVPAEKMMTFANGAPVQTLMFTWPRSPSKPPLVIRYVIVPPQQAATACGDQRVAGSPCD